ncbi:hypothetical protein TWF481_008771 [Arthrobotrys musiformis]|uniref:Zn(2)-C6 fungal-type domain-containing protein n=1 Tax=Arthrobotrys musiformis TaxID=47236 RepID=A0AAV9W938_9PEZI
MDKVSESPFISLQPAQFTPHSTVLHFRPEKPAESSSESSSRVRRFHHKTRTGCRECKQKRRKCNEAKPSCQGCIKSKIECHYEDVIPPRVQPKNRKRPQRKPAPNRFVFIEFGESGTATNSTGQSVQTTNVTPGSSHSSTSTEEILRWQSAPTTCLLQGGRTRTEAGGINREVELLYLFRNITFRTLPLQYYDTNRWSRITFESSYAQSCLYDVMLALAASHQRFLQGGLTRTAKEISHYVKALAGFRSVVSSPGNFAMMDPKAWISVLITAALLSMYIMSCPVDNYENSCDTYFSLTQGTMNMLAEAIKRGLGAAIGFKASEFTPPPQDTRSMSLGQVPPQDTRPISLGEIPPHAHQEPGSMSLAQLAEIPPHAHQDASSMSLGHMPPPRAVSLVFPGLDYAASEDDRATSPRAAQRLSDILTVITTLDVFSARPEVVANLQKVALEWAAMPDALLLNILRARNKKAYLVTAHYHAGLWKIREMIHSLCRRGIWSEASGAVDSFWWMVSPKGICKGSLEMLEEEPAERVFWVKAVVRELESIK